MLLLIRDFILINKYIQIIATILLLNIAIMQDPVDGIVAVVENKIILKSDVILNMQLSGIQLNQNSLQIEKIYNDFLNQMINDNILLVAAEKDTNVFVDDNMVSLRLNEYMRNIINEVGSEENLTTMFNKSIREIKYYYRQQIYDTMLREMYIYNYLGNLEVSRKEVEKFYNTYRDSLPITPSKYDFSIIEVPITPSNNEIKRVEKIQADLLAKINNGAFFNDIAKEFSEDYGTAKTGGDQGYYKKGTLFPEFEDIAFNLKKGEVSSPTRTPLGYHIIKLIDKDGEKINTKHILTIIKTSEKDKDRCLEELENIYQITLNDPGVFDSLAVIYNEKYNNESGIYSGINENEIPINIIKVLTNNGQYTLSKPIINNSQTKYTMIYSYNTLKAARPTIKNNWEEIELYAKNKKQSNLLNKLIDKLKHKTFIKYYD